MRSYWGVETEGTDMRKGREFSIKDWSSVARKKIKGIAKNQSSNVEIELTIPIDDEPSAEMYERVAES